MVDIYNPGVNISCNCCGNVGQSCLAGTCGLCINASGNLEGYIGGVAPYSGSVGVPAGLHCEYPCTAISYYDHKCLDIQSSGTVSSASGIMTQCISATTANITDCEQNRYVEIMVTIPEFSPGIQGCKTGGGSYIMINPRYNALGFLDALSPFPYFGVEGDSAGRNGNSYLSPCSKNIDITQPNFISEFGTTCRWEYGGGDYMFYDVTDGNIRKRCTTHVPACSECYTTTLPGVFGGGGGLPVTYGQFSITFFTNYISPAQPNTNQGPVLTITVGNMILPTDVYGNPGAFCRALSMAYAPVSGNYINCPGIPTVFKKQGVQPSYYNPTGIDYGNFPEFVELEVL